MDVNNPLNMVCIGIDPQPDYLPHFGIRPKAYFFCDRG